MRLRKLLVLVVGSMACVFYGTGQLAAAPSHYVEQPVAMQQVQPDAHPTPSTSSSPLPSPSPQPTATVKPQARTVAAIKGNSLKIPTIGLSAPMINVGLTADRAIDVPAGMQVGYYVGSARPGQPGATFLDGHVDGIFARLHRVAAGHTITINYENIDFNYRIVHTETVLLDGIDMKRALSVYDDATEGLTIMTCAGNYMPHRGTYDHRFVVYAVRVP